MSDESREIERVENVDADDWEYVTPCRRCGKEVHLKWREGAFDWERCCDLRYELVTVRTDLVVSELPLGVHGPPAPPEPPREPEPPPDRRTPLEFAAERETDGSRRVLRWAE